MEHKPLKPMTPFDHMVTPSNVYTLKLMLPYIPHSMQRMLGIYIKFMEFRYTIDRFIGFEESEASSVLDGLKEYMGPEEKEMMEQMEMIMNMMEMMKDQPDMPDMFGSMFGDMFHTPDSGEQKGDETDE